MTAVRECLKCGRMKRLYKHREKVLEGTHRRSLGLRAQEVKWSIDRSLHDPKVQLMYRWSYTYMCINSLSGMCLPKGRLWDIQLQLLRGRLDDDTSVSQHYFETTRPAACLHPHI